MLFFIVHDVPGRVRLRARYGFSLRKAQVLADRLDAVGGIEGVRVNPRTGSVLLLYANDEAKRAAFLLLAVAASEQPSGDVAVCGENLPEPAGRPSWGPFLRYIFVRPFMPVLVRVATAVAASVPFILKGVAALCRGRLSVDVLDAAAIGISLLRRDFKTARLLTLLLGFGEALEAWTRKKSLDTLAQSLALDVDTVWVRREGREMHVAISELSEDDLVIVRTGSAIPVDGVVAEGEASVNQASMTGEPLGVLRSPGSSVYAGTVVEEGEIAIRPTGVGDGTRLRQIVRFIEDSEALKAGVQGKAERLADAVVPFSFLLAGLVWLVTRNPARAASVLLVDYSCALKLSTPLAVLAAMKEGVGRGVLVKGGRFLEAVSEASAIVFDKTGTLTRAEPKIAQIVTFGGNDEADMLRLAACLEEHYPHSMAKAVVAEAARRGLRHEERHSRVEYLVAHGISSSVDGQKVVIGSHHFVFEDEHCVIPAGEQAKFDALPDTYSHLYLAVSGVLTAVICIEDPLRPEAADVIRGLRELGVNKLVMMTGDNEKTARAVAEAVGVDAYFEDKAAFIQAEHAAGRKVIMLGDGVNDSPALSEADAGVAISDGAAIAREVADITVGADDLYALLTLKRLSDALMERIHSNYRKIISFNFLLICLGVAGVLPPATSALLHNASTLVISLKSMTKLLA